LGYQIRDLGAELSPSTELGQNPGQKLIGFLTIGSTFGA
jgi:hypothetical protein